jgi:hypothetical protein
MLMTPNNKGKNYLSYLRRFIPVNCKVLSYTVLLKAANGARTRAGGKVHEHNFACFKRAT